MKKIALIYNYAQHYRTNIFTLMDKDMNIDFYFGDDMGDVKKMDYSLIKHSIVEIHNSNIGPFEWQSDVVKLAFKPYDSYIILAGPMSLSTWLFTICARIMGKQIIFWSHGWYGKENKIQKLIKKIFFRLPSINLLYGNYARKLMIKEGFCSKKLVTIHNSLMYDKQIEIRKNLQLSNIYKSHFGNELPNIIFVGRLTHIKQLHLLLESLALNKEKGFLYNVIFIGDGAEKKKLQSLCDKNKLSEYVWFYGPSYDEKELSSLIFNADLCVAPGNIGLTAMHAMAYGCPCISHNDFKWQMPEFEAIVEGKTGTFFEKNNVKALAESIYNWLKEKSSYREDVRKACFVEIDNNWNPHKQLEIIQKIINN